METVPAARGRLLDRNGTVLVQDQVTWQAQVDQDTDPAVRQRLAALCREEGWPGPAPGLWRKSPPPPAGPGEGGGPFRGHLHPGGPAGGAGDVGPHVLGRVGQMSPEEWETYGAQGYTMDALVGKDGAEAAFEAYLHGTPGQRMVETDEAGRVTSTSYAQEPQAGRDVTLTLDWDLQTAAEEALAAFLDSHPQSTGGALVALDVNDGGCWPW